MRSKAWPALPSLVKEQRLEVRTKKETGKPKGRTQIKLHKILHEQRTRPVFVFCFLGKC